jgi:hypothetical protein
MGAPDEFRIKLEEGRTAVVDALRHVARIIEAAPLPDAGDALTHLRAKLEELDRDLRRVLRGDRG